MHEMNIPLMVVQIYTQHTSARCEGVIKDLGLLSVPLCFYSSLAPLTIFDIPWLSLYVPFPFKYISQAFCFLSLQHARIIVNKYNITLLQHQYAQWFY